MSEPQTQAGRDLVEDAPHYREMVIAIEAEAYAIGRQAARLWRDDPYHSVSPDVLDEACFWCGALRPNHENDCDWLAALRVNDE